MLTKYLSTTLMLLLLVLLASGCGEEVQQDETPIAPTQTEPAQEANPASVHCLEVGGTLSIQERGDGGQYGICHFEDNRQCEEWALLREECPEGGLEVTGYVTTAARYCAITGSTYTVTGNSGAEDEEGTCTFKDDSLCDAWEYYNGECAPGAAPVAGIEPLQMEVCNGQAQAMSHTLDDLIPTQSEEPLQDFVTGASGTGCQATITGTGLDFESPDAVVNELGGMLEEQGWTEDPMLAAGGPTGMGEGYRKDDQICLVNAIWFPDEAANCPDDQPISACSVTPEQQLYTVTLNCGVESSTGQATSTTDMANPASVTCTAQSGTLTIEERGDGGQFGVCYFEDNRGGLGAGLVAAWNAYRLPHESGWPPGSLRDEPGWQRAGKPDHESG